MTINRTTLLDLPLPVTGTESGVWGDVVNNGLSQYIDISVAGSLSLSADSDTNLSSTEGDASATNIGSTTAQYAILRCTGARTATRNINAPAWAISGGTLTNYSKIYIVVNETTGSQNIVLRATDSATPTYTTGVTIVPGERAVCAWNGSDFVKVGGAAGGSTTQVQYNNAGVFAGSANFVFDGTNVGIGTSSPADRLDVRQAGVAARFTSTNGNANQIALSNSATAVVGFYMGSPAADVLQFSSSAGSERMRITSAGLVGIGTTTPNTFTFNNLVVASGSANAGMAIYGTGQTTFAFATGTSGSDSYRGYIQYTGGGTDTMTFGTVATERMRITSAGNVGIGTTTPGTYLEVASPSGSGSGQINIHSPGGGGIITKLISERSGAFRISAEGGSASGITFETGNSVTPVERMRITNTGNVGVGVTPSAWDTVTPIQIKNASFAGYSTTNAYMLQNAYYASGWKYISNGAAARFEINGSSYEWSGAASGTAGNAITFTPILTIDKDKTLALQGATSSTGTGIAFPATQSASSDANTLDDYEEGTWTPSLGGTATYSDQTGTYTKIGRQVTVRYRIAVSSIGTGSTTTLTGLPFTASGNGAGALYWDTSLVAMVYCTGFATSTSIVFYRASSGDFSLSTGSGIFKNGTTVDGITTYFV